MPNHKAAEKRLKQDAKRHLRNVSTKSRIRTLIKKVRASVTEKQATVATEQLKIAISALDTAAKKHIIHPRNASRRKSRLMHLVGSMEKG